MIIGFESKFVHLDIQVSFEIVFETAGCGSAGKE